MTIKELIRSLENLTDREQEQDVLIQDNNGQMFRVDDLRIAAKDDGYLLAGDVFLTFEDSPLDDFGTEEEIE